MKIEPVGFITEHDEGPMYWDSLAEALTYCDLGVDPEKLYTESQLRQLVEACAAVCDSIAKGRNSVVGTRCADSVRRLIKELLPSAAAELAKQEKS